MLLAKDMEAKLKAISKDRAEQTRTQLRDLDSIAPLDCDDFSKNHEILKKIRSIKQTVDQSDLLMREIDEVKDELVRKLTEQDLENLTEMLSLKITDSRERALEIKSRMLSIQASCQAMDGNASTSEEEVLVETITEELPAKLEQAGITIDQIDDLETSLNEVLQQSDMLKLNELKSNSEKATIQVEELEDLVNTLEKELLNWNGQRKLKKRDHELEEIDTLITEYTDDLAQERQNTEIELERNREKQDENRGQDMVDIDGNKVDIVADLERLEEQMQAYIVDIDEQMTGIRGYQVQKEELQEAFDLDAPKVIIEGRKRRQAGTNKPRK